MDKVTKAKFNIIVSMIIWGSIGIFVREIALSSLQIAFFRALIGSIFLIIVILVKKIKIDKNRLKKNILFLLLSGIALGVNWILLFQAMRFTTISNAILSYYFAPVFIVLFSAIVFKEEITIKNIFFLLVSIVGLFIIMKANGAELMEGFDHLRGIAYGLMGAVIYAVVVLLNKSIRGLSGIHTTFFQLLIATLSLTPFILTDHPFKVLVLNNNTWILMLTIGVLHTGIAYLLYFSSIKNLQGKSIAILSYLDPMVAIAISFVFLGESMNSFQIIGGLLILSSSYLSEKSNGK